MSALYCTLQGQQEKRSIDATLPEIISLAAACRSQQHKNDALLATGSYKPDHLKASATAGWWLVDAGWLVSITNFNYSYKL